MVDPTPAAAPIPGPIPGPQPLTPFQAFRRGLAIQRAVVGALVMRELHTRYGRENIGYVWLVLEPMMLAGAITLLHVHGTTMGSDIRPVPFALVGYCNYIMFRGIFNRAEGAVESNLPLLYHRTVTILDIMLSRALLEAASTVSVFVLLMALAIALGVADLPVRPAFLLLGIVTLFLLCFGLSLAVVSITHENRAAARFVHPIAYVMLPLSGVFTPMQWLPHAIQDLFWYIPLTHIFELLRFGQFRAARPDFIDPYYLTAWILGVTLLGLLGISQLRNRIHMP